MDYPKTATLECVNCPATARDTSKERGRFKRRHPSLCDPSLWVEHQNKHSEKAQFTQQLAEVRSVEDDK